MLKEILRILEADSRTSKEQIATMIGISVADVTSIIGQAEKDRIILKYKTVINWDKVEDEQVWALIGVKLTPQKNVGFDSIAEQIYRFPETRTVYLISGSVDLIVLVIGKSAREIANFVSQKLSTIEGVQETNTQFLLKRYKEDGEIIDGREDVKRQPVVF
ncbi:MAG: Lrp/AsnC family transcriptional regulator [Chloroflexota bacterium]